MEAEVELLMKAASEPAYTNPPSRRRPAIRA